MLDNKSLSRIETIFNGRIEKGKRRKVKKKYFVFLFVFSIKIFHILPLIETFFVSLWI